MRSCARAIIAIAATIWLFTAAVSNISTLGGEGSQGAFQSREKSTVFRNFALAQNRQFVFWETIGPSLRDLTLWVVLGHNPFAAPP